MRSTPTPAILMSLAVFVAFKPAVASAQRPVITRASADLDSGVLTLEGTNFGSHPVVSMGTSGGTFAQLTILSAPNDNYIEAQLESTAPGTYLVVVRKLRLMLPSPARSNSSRTAWRYRGRGLQFGFIDVTLGAVGYQGAPGAEASQGVAEPQGGPGPQGTPSPRDPPGRPRSGVLAFQYPEEAEGKALPDLIVHGPDGRVETVPYHKVNAILVNEMQKQERRIRQLEVQLQTLMRMRSLTQAETP